LAPDRIPNDPSTSVIRCPALKYKVPGTSATRRSIAIEPPNITKLAMITKRAILVFLFSLRNSGLLKVMALLKRKGKERDEPFPSPKG